MQTLFEKYRPKSFDEVLGQDTAIHKVKLVLSRGWGGRAWWISGASGTGKTTIARIIASQGADDLYVTEYDSADMITASEVGRIERSMCHLASGKGGRAYILNEAHGLRRTVARRFLGLLERVPNHVCFVFTTTKATEERLHFVSYSDYYGTATDQPWARAMPLRGVLCTRCSPWQSLLLPSRIPRPSGNIGHLQIIYAMEDHGVEGVCKSRSQC